MRYNRHEMNMYLLPVIISDNEYPVQSSTETVTIRVCACDQRGKMLSCNAEALIHPTGLSTGALIAILLCIIILLGKGLCMNSRAMGSRMENINCAKEQMKHITHAYNYEILLVESSFSIDRISP